MHSDGSISFLKRKSLLLIIPALAFMFAISVAVLVSDDDSSADSGSCGDLDYEYEDGILTINGNGSILNYELINRVTTAPWSYFSADIVQVKIGDDVNSVGDFAFSGLKNLKSVVLGSSVKSIGTGSFMDCSALGSIQMNEGLTTIGTKAFFGTGFKDVTFPESLEVVDKFAFCSSDVETLLFLSKDISPELKEYSFAYCSNLKSVLNFVELKTKDNTFFHSMDNSILVDTKSMSTPSYAEAHGAAVALAKMIDPSTCHIRFISQGNVIYECDVNRGERIPECPIIPDFIGDEETLGMFLGWQPYRPGTPVFTDTDLFAKFHVIIIHIAHELPFLSYNMNSVQSVDISKELFATIVDEAKEGKINSFTINNGDIEIILDRSDLIAMEGEDPIFTLDDITELFDASKIHKKNKVVKAFDLDIGPHANDIKVNFRIPVDYVEDGMQPAIIHFIGPEKFEYVPCQLSDGVVSFEASGFSEYVLVYMDDNSDNKTVMGVAFAAIAIIAILGAVFYARKP